MKTTQKKPIAEFDHAKLEETLEKLSINAQNFCDAIKNGNLNDNVFLARANNRLMIVFMIKSIRGKFYSAKQNYEKDQHEWFHNN